jgi:amino acid transporter
MADVIEEGTERSGEERTELKRVMGPGLLLLFIVGDILGTGIYALTGQVAAEIGGAVWLPFLVAFVVAIITAFSYLELVTKYPHAAGAALYTHKAFGIHFFTFMVCFTVMSSGITSASTASRAFAANLFAGFNVEIDSTAVAVTLVALGFMALVALVNFRGVGESVKANVVLTCVELSGLLIIILIGLYALGFGEDADFSRAGQIAPSEGQSVFVAITAATSLAFFAMVGFEDSVNMAEETKDPVRTFPKIMLIGLCVTGGIYVLVSVTAVALVPLDELSEGATPLLQVVEAGAPGLPLDRVFPFIAMFAVANSALINMLMASRLLYGMAREEVLPPVLSRVHRGGARRGSRSPSRPCSRPASSSSSEGSGSSAARRRCSCSASSPSSTWRCWCSARTRWTTSTSVLRPPCRSSAPSRAPTWSHRCRDVTSSSTRSPASCS